MTLFVLQLVLDFFVVEVVDGAGAVLFEYAHGSAYGTLSELFAEVCDQIFRILELFTAVRTVIIHQINAPSHEIIR